MLLLCTIYSLFILYAIVLLWRKGRIELHAFDLDRTTSLKGVLAFLMILVHLNCVAFKPAGFKYPVFSEIGSVWGQWCVILFFMMAGYGLTYSLSTKGTSYLDGFLKKRLPKILVPLLLVEIVAICCNLLSISELIRGGQQLAHTWFMYALLLYYVAFYVVNRLVHNIRHSTFILLLLQVLFICLVRYLSDDQWTTWRWWASALGFNTGMYIYLYEPQIQKLLKPLKPLKPFILAIGLLGGLAAIYASAHFGLAEYAASIGWPILTYVLILICGMYQSTLTRWLGKYCYEIYLTHGYLIMTYPHWPWHTAYGNLAFGIMIFAAVAVSSIILKRISQYILNLHVHRL